MGARTGAPFPLSRRRWLAGASATTHELWPITSMRRTHQPRGTEAPKIPAVGNAHVPFRVLFSALVLCASGLVVYANSISAPFFFDDKHAIIENSHLRTLFPLRQSLAAPPDTPLAGRPVASFTFAVNYAVGGLSVEGYRAGNIALHIATAFVLYQLAMRTFAGPVLNASWGRYAHGLALAISLLWLVHPLNSETVTYVTQRTELLMGLCYLTTLWTASKAWDTRHPAVWSVASIVGCALGMASKEVMVSAPLMVALYDRVFVSRSWSAAWSARWPLYLGLASTWGLLAVLVADNPRATSVGFDLGMSVWDYACTQCWAICRYLRLAIWPDALCADYGDQPVTAIGDVLPGALIVVFLLVASVFAWRKSPEISVLGAWFFLLLAPSSSFLPITTEVAAERRMYLPLIGVLAAAVATANRVFLMGKAKSKSNAWVRAATTMLTATIVVLLGARTVARNTVFQDTVALWYDVVRQMPENARGHYQLAEKLWDRGDVQRALDQYRVAASLEPSDAVLQNLVGARYASVGRNDMAEAYFLRSLQLRPDSAHAHKNVANLQVLRGDLSAAAVHYEQALASAPGMAEASKNLGIIYMRRGDPASAAQVFSAALAIEPENSEMRALLRQASASCSPNPRP